MDLTKEIERIIAAGNKRNELESDFKKQVILICSSFLGVLIALHKTPHNQDTARLVFLLVLVLLSASILLLTLALYHSVAAHKQLYQRMVKQILSQMSGESEEGLALTSVSKKLIFVVIEFLGYATFLLAIICLTYYGYLIA